MRRPIRYKQDRNQVQLINYQGRPGQGDPDNLTATTPVSRVLSTFTEKHFHTRWMPQLILSRMAKCK